jgi:hypothetical protein
MGPFLLWISGVKPGYITHNNRQIVDSKIKYRSICGQGEFLPICPMIRICVMRIEVKGWVGCLVLLLVVPLCCFLAIAGEDLFNRINTQTVYGYVEDIYQKRVNESDIYHVAFEQTNGTHEVYWNKDAPSWGKWTSANIQQVFREAKEKHEYCTFTVTGWRIPAFSWFQNITQYSCVPGATQ